MEGCGLRVYEGPVQGGGEMHVMGTCVVQKDFVGGVGLGF